MIYELVFTDDVYAALRRMRRYRSITTVDLLPFMQFTVKAGAR